MPPPLINFFLNQGGGFTGVQPPPPHPKFKGGCDPPPLFGAADSFHYIKRSVFVPNFIKVGLCILILVTCLKIFSGSLIPYIYQACK